MKMKKKISTLQTEMVEGPEAWEKFKGVMRKVLAAPRPKAQKPASKRPAPAQQR